MLDCVCSCMKDGWLILKKAFESVSGCVLGLQCSDCRFCQATVCADKSRMEVDSRCSLQYCFRVRPSVLGGVGQRCRCEGESAMLREVWEAVKEEAQEGGHAQDGHM
jgi:hypothetical protein